LQRQMGTDRFDRAQAALRTGNVHGYPPERRSRRTLSLRVAMGGPPLSVKGPDPEFTAPTGPAYIGT
jgi:hypothetical protein